MRQSVGKIIKIITVIVFCVAYLAPSLAFAALPERILSITPAGTEILFDLGLGGRVIGVTRYCSWPPEAQALPSLGDMMHVNLEVLMGLEPDLILVSNMNYQAGEQAEALGYSTVTVYQDDFEQICDSILRVGRECGIEEKAVLRVEQLRAEVREKTLSPGANPSRVLIAVGRDPSEETLRRIHVAGPRSFYDDLLTRAGAVNAYTGDAAYSQISREGLLRLDPDVIIELTGTHGMEVPTDRIASQWDAVPELRAVQNGRVSVIRGDFTLRAGPRYPLILDTFIKIIRDGAREISHD